MPQIVEYIGPQITPLVLFAAMAPACPDSFTWSNPEPRPKVPQMRELTSDQRAALDADEDLTPELAAWVERRHDVEIAHGEWVRRDQYGRQVAWRWFYASLMLHAMPVSEKAPEVMRDPPPSPLLDRALEAFAIERARQVHEKGYMAWHDDEHTAGELARAAAWYAIPLEAMPASVSSEALCALWPSDWSVPDSVPHPTPAQRKRELEKAGALLAAEWERLDRLELAR